MRCLKSFGRFFGSRSLSFGYKPIWAPMDTIHWFDTFDACLTFIGALEKRELYSLQIYSKRGERAVLEMEYGEFNSILEFRRQGTTSPFRPV